MESSAPRPPVRLSARVRDLALAAVGGTRVREDVTWLSPSGTVWRVSGESDTVYVKRAAGLAGERDRLAWLAGRWRRRWSGSCGLDAED